MYNAVLQVYSTRRRAVSKPALHSCIGASLIASGEPFMQSVLIFNRFLTVNIKIALLIFPGFGVVFCTAVKSYDILFQPREAGQVSAAVYDAQDKIAIS